MSNYVAAKHLASYGRGPDTELVHMTKGEIKGLQSLALAHGGSLTINPHTGLVEAGFLSKILPMLAGGALMMIPGVNAVMAAGLVGGGVGLAKGSLKEGLMAGLSAYGGAGLAGGLMSSGASTLASEASTVANAGGLPNAATTPVLEAAGSGAAVPPPPVVTTPPPGAITPPPPGAITPDPVVEVAQHRVSLPPGTQAPAPVAELGKQFTAPTSSPWEQFSKGFGKLDSAQGWKDFVGTAADKATGVKETGLGGGFGAATKTLAAASPMLEPEPFKAPGPKEPDEYDKRLAGIRLGNNFQASEPVRPNPYPAPNYPVYAAEGGLMGMAMGGPAPETNFATPSQSMMGTSQYSMATDPMTGNIAQRNMASGGIARYYAGDRVLAPLPESVGVPRTGIFHDQDIATSKEDAWNASRIRLAKAAKAAGIKLAAEPKARIKGLGDVSGATPDTTDAARGGVMSSHLGGYSDGGRMLKGPGDGMSDSIPATISGKQPARLADGEFVVPADVVSHLGNGSTDAGAKKLYSMMDKIRKARTGKKRQAPAVNSNKFMPA
jgi:hypothetical protein